MSTQNYSKWNIITPNFKIHNTCFETYPCKHAVSINNTESLMSAVNIYKFFVVNNLTVDKHFEYCKKIVESEEVNNILDEFIKTTSMDEIKEKINFNTSPYIKNKALFIAIRLNNFKVVKYLVDDLNTTIPKDIVIDFHTKNEEYSTEIFRYLLQKSNCNIDYILHNVSQYAKFEYLKCIIEEFGDKISGDKVYKDALASVGCFSSDFPDTQKIVEYLVKLSNKKNIIYSGEEVRKCASRAYLLRECNLLYNNNFKPSIHLNYNKIKLDKDPKFDKIFKSNKTEKYMCELLGLSHGNLANMSQYTIYFDEYIPLRKISFKIKTNDNSIFDKVSFAFNEYQVKFKKTLQNDYIVFTFNPIESPNLIHTLLTTKKIVFHFNKSTNNKKIDIKELHFNIDFIDDPTYIHNDDTGWENKPDGMLYFLTKNKALFTKHGFSIIFNLKNKSYDNADMYKIGDISVKKLIDQKLENIDQLYPFN